MGGCEFGNNGNMSLAPLAPGRGHILLFSTIATRPVVDAAQWARKHEKCKESYAVSNNKVDAAKAPIYHPGIGLLLILYRILCCRQQQGGCCQGPALPPMKYEAATKEQQDHLVSPSFAQFRPVSPLIPAGFTSITKGKSRQTLLIDRKEMKNSEQNIYPCSYHHELELR